MNENKVVLVVAQNCNSALDYMHVKGLRTAKYVSCARDLYGRRGAEVHLVGLYNHRKDYPEIMEVASHNGCTFIYCLDWR